MSDQDDTDPAGAPPHAADLALLKAARDGDELAQHRLSERMRCIPRFVSKHLRRYGVRNVADLTADISQEVFSRLWAKADTYLGLSSLEGWAWGYALQVTRAQVQARWSSKDVPLDENFDLPGAIDEDSETAVVGTILEALEAMPAIDQTIIRLHVVESLAYDEVGKRVGLSPRASRSRYSRALEKLRERFGPTVDGQLGLPGRPNQS